MTMTMIIAIVLATVFIAFCLLCIVVLSANHRETKEFQKKFQSIERDLEDMNVLILDKLNQHEELLEKQTTIMEMNSKTESVKQAAVCGETAPQRDFEKSHSQAAVRESLQQVAAREQHENAAIQEVAVGEDWGINLNDLMGDIEDVEDFVDVGAFEDVIPKESAEGSVTSKDEKDIDMLSDILGIESTLNDFDDFTQRTLHGKQLFENIPQEPKQAYMPDSEPVYEPKPETIYVPNAEPDAVSKPNPAQNVDYAVGRSGKKYTSSELEKLIRG